MYGRYDATRTERFTLSKGSGRLLGTMKQPLEVDFYVTRGLAKLDSFVYDLEDLLKEYQAAGDGKFRYSIIEAKTDEQKEIAKEAGLREAAFGEGSETGEDQASIKQGFMGLVFKYGSETDSIPILQPDRTDGLEFWITNKIRELRDKADGISHRIGVVSGKDEIKLTETNLVPGQGRGDPSMQALVQQHWPFYKFEDVDLQGGDNEIDPELVGLIITQPGKAFSLKELRRIDQFVMRGRSLVVFAGAANLKSSDSTMKASMNLHGLDSLLTGYGIEIYKNVAIDWMRPMRIQLPTYSGGSQVVMIPGVAQVQNQPGESADKQTLDNGFPPFFRLGDLAFPYPSTIALHPDKQPDAKMSVVARTSERAAVMNGDSVDLRPLGADMKPKPPFNQFPIAAAVEGTLKRAIDPPSSAEDEIAVPASSAGDARVLVIASGQFLTNPFVRAGKGPDLGPQFAMMGANIGGDEQLMFLSQFYVQYMTQAIVVFKNTLDWMSGDSDLIAVSAKILGESNLVYPQSGGSTLTESSSDEEIKAESDRVRTARKTTQGRVQWTLTAVLPIAFAAFGIALWLVRENRRSTLRVK